MLRKIREILSDWLGVTALAHSFSVDRIARVDIRQQITRKSAIENSEERLRILEERSDPLQEKTKGYLLGQDAKISHQNSLIDKQYSEIEALKERVASLEEIVLSYQKESATKVAEPKRRQYSSWTEFRVKMEAESALSNDAT